MAATVSKENLDATRLAVRDLLSKSQAFNALDEDRRRQLANDLVQIGTYLAEPDGVRVGADQQSAPIRALAEEGGGRRLTANRNNSDEGVFTAQSAREGAAVAGALLEAVNFPEFVSGLIDGVFHSIVTSSIQQMEAYAKLVADVSKSLNQFRDDNTTQNQGRDHLIEQFPDVFELTMDTGDFGADFGSDSGARRGPRVRVREGVDERTAMARINQSLPLEQPLNRLDDALVESVLVPAARTQLASSRQQLLATTIMLGINRIVVTDGKIQAKVMYDFQARDNMQFRKSAQQFDYGDQYVSTSSGTYEGEGSSSRQGASRGADGSYQGGSRDSNYYSKGEYKHTSQPVLKLASASQTSIDASLTTKASLAGVVEVNFKSDYLPLEKLANPEAIAAIQGNAQPGMVKNIVNRPAAPAPANPAAPAA
ncbi:hypothetical protein N8I74_14445 [Chitiniphilus purpureus]|uniref:DUF1631 domain-containing protein n=1 Tax=Chitiniphilus purpureus TaxID=2981137 RepID=A0ABY6DJU5_9NEIS|nr:hypothetical protein [Chitiniphilus sp. CD1]UXY14508.1 hypothetical protein N8I74_14445 [Chitiniphilus sp. CD1]